ncbi:MAG: tRNA (N6-isopentenyl adenosine(37)-C2)-methylthiotransferase MiaB [Clostridia bacterium]|nr:tRNA (N6-isopentenyl adenosine(37)-C2)-methylthiotransferase MiaB [Clostridia bacterium]
MEKQYNYIQNILLANKEKELETGKTPKARIRNFGCQMNEHDSEKIRGMICAMGYELTDENEDADLIIFNTCCVRENAEEKVFGHLGALKDLKRKYPDTVIAVCGCMTEQPTIVDIIKKKYKNVDLVFGTHNLHRFPELLYRCITGNTRVYETSRTDGEVAEGLPIERDSNIKAWVTVMYGCDNYCSYCIVPYVRGHERSRYAEDIINEIKELEKKGVVEITLLGQNVNSYGKDLENKLTFAQLLDMICRETAIPRIRFMTSHPKDLSDELIDVMARYPNICNQLHLPVQSGSSEILKRMNRRYTKEKYLELVQKVYDRIPGVALSTDVIVGFPGETEEDFEETLDLFKKVRYEMAFTFIYSKRTGTPAASYPDQVADDVVKDRFERLLDVQNKISREINEECVGKTFDVLVEGLSRTSDTHYTGRTEGNKIVNFTCDRDFTGKIIPVKIVSAQTWSLDGIADC